MGFDWETYGKKPTSFFGYIEWLYFLYCITTGLYMLERWERQVFNTCLMVLLSMSFYTAYLFLPQHIYAMLAHFGLITSATS